MSIASINKVNWPFDHVVTRGFMKNEKRYISTSITHTATKHHRDHRVVAYDNGSKPTESCSTLIVVTWGHTINEKRCTSFFTKTEASKHYRAVVKGPLTINSHNVSSRGHVRSHDKLLLLLLPLPPGYQTLQGGGSR